MPFLKPALLLNLIFTAIWMITICFYPPANSSFTEIILIFTAFGWFAFLAVKVRFLTPGGALAASIMGTQFVGVNEFSLFPLLLFFLSGSILSRLPRTKGIQDSGPRNTVQVWSNGGICFLIGLISHLSGKNLELYYLIAIAAATADTWSSEIGIRFSKQPFDILSFRKIKPGISGAISLKGLIAGLGGALVIGLFSETNAGLLMVCIFGFMGTIADSVLGSRLQALYRNHDGELTEQKTDQLFKGFAWANNDLINLLSIAITVVLAFLFQMILH